MRLLIDGNSLLNAALLRGVDHEYGRVIKTEDGKQTQVNGFQYGVDGFFEKLLAALKEFGAAPRQVVCVWDGRNAKVRRRAFLPQYKLGRDKAPEINEQLNLAREACIQHLKDLGATNAWQDGMEADDVIGYLCKNARTVRNVVVTSDGDLTVLVDSNTDVWRLGKLNENPYGPFPHKFITLYKSLVGDTSDKIPGAKGFGDGAWVDLVRIFGIDGLSELERMLVCGELPDLKQSVPDMPKLQKILDSIEDVSNSWRCASLHIESVNTMSRPLTIVAGMVKQRGEVGDDFPVDFEGWYGTKTLVTADNFNAVYSRFTRVVPTSPFVALDIETSSGEESDDWLDMVAKALERKEDRAGIDVLGHELTGMSITFGDNTQHTIYMSVDHADTANITVDQCRLVCEAIPQNLHTVIQNRNFEFSVLYRTWGDEWKDNGWHGFIPNAVDTKIGASYVDENLPKGLKERSKLHLGYEQATYAETTTLEGPVGSLQPGGKQVKVFEKVIKPAVYGPAVIEVVDYETGEVYEERVENACLEAGITETWEARQYKMRELTARQVFDYGCDDTICTAALHTFYQLVMDIEQTWSTYLQVEQLPEYLTTLAYVQGIRVNIGKVREMEKRDDEAYDKAWATLREFLMAHGWEGSTCPEFEGSIEPSDVKLAAAIVLDGEFSTRKRKLNAIAADIREQFPDDVKAEVLAMAVERNNVAALNQLVKASFTGEPKINFGSPAQMQNLFYNVIGMTPRIFNKLTAKQKEDGLLVRAFKKQRDLKAGKRVTFTDEEHQALISKASTDDSAVDSALALDNLSDDAKAVLKAYQAIKSIQTRRNLFYRTYKAMPHWRDGRIHPNLNQCEAVTRRYSSSGPNVQQLPARGAGAEFREVIQPHHKDAVIISCDFAAQEVRSIAFQSQDEALLSCYIGDNLYDIHSLTAVAASEHLWDKPVTYPEFMEMLQSEDPEIKARAKALRASSKTTRFASLYGAQAANIAQQLMVDEATAQRFLDAQDAATPGVNKWKDRVEGEAAQRGYAVDLVGCRRHLQSALQSENRGEASRAARQASNFAIQASSAAQTKLAMASMWKSGMFTGKYDAKFYFPIHDECVASVHRDQALEFVREFHACMTQDFAGMTVPIASSIEIGPNFGDLTEIGEAVDEARILETLKNLCGG